MSTVEHSTASFNESWHTAPLQGADAQDASRLREMLDRERGIRTRVASEWHAAEDRLIREQRQ